ncbi:MAG: hypothetical protein VX910_07645 [Candidatus Latescibacterota bacterium]|nr:hypothetical protein [Candidatus Latescibacterota bacterium]
MGDTEDRLYTKPNQTANILIVGHIGTIGPIMYYLIGFPVFPWIYEKVSLGYAGICRPRTVPLVGQWMWSLTPFNDPTHLGIDIF